jgi:fibrillarin-like rRNA methylase
VFNTYYKITIKVVDGLYETVARKNCMGQEKSNKHFRQENITDYITIKIVSGLEINAESISLSHR